MSWLVYNNVALNNKNANHNNQLLNKSGLPSPYIFNGGLSLINNNNGNKLL